MELNLSPKELEVLSNLTDPDRVEQNQYVWDEEFQREMLGLLLRDKTFVVQVDGLIKSNYFRNEAHRMSANILFDFFKSYKCLPTKIQLLEEFKSKISSRDSKTQLYYTNEINTTYEYYVPNFETRSYYVDKIKYFAKFQALRSAFNKSLEEISKSPESEEVWANVEKYWQQALSVDRNTELGLDYFKDPEERYERMQKKIDTGDVFVTGFKDIDDSITGGGIGRGEIASIVGLSGTGKSVFLANIALANLNRGKRVLYISLELDQDTCAGRFDALLTNPNPWGEDNSGVTMKNLLEKKEQVFQALKAYVSDKDNKQLFILKQFPAGELGMSDLRAYYSKCVLEGFQPDMIIIDYIGEMKDYPNMPTWESRQKLVRDLRGFGTIENIGLFTAMQPDKKARENIKLGGVIDDDNLADAYGQVRPLDALWSINMMNDEKDCGVARLFVIKHRNGTSRFVVYMQMDKGSLHMRQISENKYTGIYNKYRNSKTTNVADIQKYEGKKKKTEEQLEKIFAESAASTKAGVSFQNESYAAEDVVGGING